MLFKNTSLLALSLIPISLTLIAIISLLALSVSIAGKLVGGIEPVREQMRLLAQAMVLVLAIFITHILYVPLARVLLAPFAEAISRRTSKIIGAPVTDTSRGVIRSIIEGAKLVSLQLVIGLAAIFISFAVPPVAGFIGVASAILFVSIDYLDVPLSVRGYGLRQKLGIIGGNKALACGFGMAGYLLLIIPVLNLLSLPVGVIGATLATSGLKPGEEGLTRSGEKARG